MAQTKVYFEDHPEVKYTKIFINNEWVDSGELHCLHELWYKLLSCACVKLEQHLH